MKTEDFIKGNWYVFTNKENGKAEYILRFTEIDSNQFCCDMYIIINNKSLHKSVGSLDIYSYSIHLATYELAYFAKKEQHLFPQYFSKTSNKDVILDNAEMCLEMSNHSNKSTKRNQLTW